MMTRYDADKLIWAGIQQPDDSFRKLFVQKGADEKTIDKLQRYLFEQVNSVIDRWLCVPRFRRMPITHRESTSLFR